MATLIRHYGRACSGIPRLYNMKIYQKNVDSLEGKEFELTIKEHIEKPSIDQHAYYRGAVIEIGLTASCFNDWTGDELDAYFSDKYLGYNIHKVIKHKDGRIESVTIRVVPSKGEGFSKKKMAEFIDRCVAEIASEGVIVHSPEQWKLNKYKNITQQQ